MLFFLSPQKRFLVINRNGHTFIDSRSFARYDQVTQVFASIDFPGLQHNEWAGLRSRGRAYREDVRMRGVRSRTRAMGLESPPKLEA